MKTPDKSSRATPRHAIGEPVAATVVGPEYGPEFVDAKGLERLFGIRRALAYQLLHEGRILGVSIRRPGTVRGKRLFQVESVRALLMSQMES